MLLKKMMEKYSKSENIIMKNRAGDSIKRTSKGQRAGKFLSLLICGLLMTSMATACSTGNKGGDTGNSTSQTSQASAKNFPNFKLTDSQGKEVDNSIFKDNKLTIVNLWNTGCQACISEMPNLEKMNKDFEKKGAKIVGLSYDMENKPEEIKSILKKQGVSYQNLIMNDKSGKEIKSFMDEIFAFPTTFFIDKDGKIIHKMEGTIDSPERIKEIEKLIDSVAK